MLGKHVLQRGEENKVRLMGNKHMESVTQT